MATQPSRFEANRLYWDTDSSVGRIAEQLSVSRRALYELLDPATADGPCPGCGQPLLFANRLARAAGDAICLGCGSAIRLPVHPRPPEPDREPAAPLKAPTARSRRITAVPNEAAVLVPAAPDLEPTGRNGRHLQWTSPLGIRRQDGLPMRLIGLAALALAAGLAAGLYLKRRDH